MKEQVLVCPVCGGALLRTERQYTCPAGHSFDVAKEGYVNLLCTSKPADKMGDSKESAAARHAFLERGYYGCLKEALTPLLHGNVLDICCGEGYYDSVPADGALYGFDLSKTWCAWRLSERTAANTLWRIWLVCRWQRVALIRHCICLRPFTIARLLGCWRPAGGCTA